MEHNTTNQTKLKLSIADDHPIVINGLEKILKGHSLIDLIYTANEGASLLEKLKQQQPDVLLLDIQMPGLQGDELCKIISDLYPAVAILILTNMNLTFHVRNLFMNGAKGYLLKSTSESVLVEAITAVSRGQQYIDVSLREQMAYEMTDSRRAKIKSMLTKREQKILEMIAEEKTNEDISKELFLSRSTVENHRINLFFKLEVKNAAGLVRKAIQLGLIKP